MTASLLILNRLLFPQRAMGNFKNQIFHLHLWLTTCSDSASQIHLGDIFFFSLSRSPQTKKDFCTNESSKERSSPCHATTEFLFFFFFMRDLNSDLDWDDLRTFFASLATDFLLHQLERLDWNESEWFLRDLTWLCHLLLFSFLLIIPLLPYIGHLWSTCRNYIRQ